MMWKKCYDQWSWLYEHQWSYMIAMNTNHLWSISYQGILCMISDHGWTFKWSCMISGDHCHEILLIIDDQYWSLHHIMTPCGAALRDHVCSTVLCPSVLWHRSWHGRPLSSRLQGHSYPRSTASQLACSTRTPAPAAMQLHHTNPAAPSKMAFLELQSQRFSWTLLPS